MSEEAKTVVPAVLVSPAATMQPVDTIAEMMAMDEAKYNRYVKVAQWAAEGNSIPGCNTTGKVMMAWALAGALGVPRPQIGLLFHFLEFDGRVTPTMKAGVAWGFLLRDGWQFEVVEESPERVAYKVWHPERAPEPKTIEYLYSEAETAGLTTRPKSLWPKHRRSMMMARLHTRIVKMVLPLILCGLPTTEDIQDAAPTADDSAPAVEGVIPSVKLSREQAAVEHRPDPTPAKVEEPKPTEPPPEPKPLDEPAGMEVPEV